MGADLSQNRGLYRGGRDPRPPSTDQEAAVLVTAALFAVIIFSVVGDPDRIAMEWMGHGAPVSC
jgi:hypothetical protein